MANTKKETVTIRVELSPELDRAINNLQSKRTIERGGLRTTKVKVVTEALEKALLG